MTASRGSAQTADIDRPSRPSPTLLTTSGLYLLSNNPITTGNMPQLVPGRKRDEDSGRYQEEYSSEEVVAAIRRHDGQAASSDVAEELGCSRGTAYYKLRAMEEQGYVESRKIGGINIWMVAENNKQGN
jgi:uncharacterized membrane protein